MRKKVLVLVSLILLIGSWFGINELQKSSFTVFNKISTEEITNIKKSLKWKMRLDFTALLCNEIRVPFDDAAKTFYVPLNMEDEVWEKLELYSGQPEYEVIFSQDVTEYDKKEVIAEGKKFKLFVYGENEWSNYYVVFSGLPIIDLTTDQGNYFGEEIEGNATFYDLDFSLHGVTQSEYYGHIRGNTSRMFPKKGYKLSLTYTAQDGTKEQNKISVFDMRKDDDWVLLALYNDDTKIRDKLSMEVWDQIGATQVSEKSYYGPKMTYVEVFADNNYCGLYGLLEPVDGKQLDLAEEDYSYKRKEPGGLGNKFHDFLDNEDPYAMIEGFQIKDGVMKEDAWEAMAWLSEFLSLSAEDKLKREQDIINEDSALRMWLFLQIITGHDHTAKNIFYVAKYDEDKEHDYQFYFAPWDMDLTWGNVSVGEVNPYYTAFEMDTFDNKVRWETAAWMIDLNYHGAKDKVQSLYRELRTTVLTDEAVENIIERLDGQIRDSGAFARDQKRWPEGTHADDTSVLIRYAKKRLNFLDLAIEDFDYFEQ